MLKTRRLSGILQTLELRTAQAAEDDLAPTEFLLRLFTDEVERREGKILEQRLRSAQFEHRKTLEAFDFHFNPQIPKSRIIDPLLASAAMDRLLEEAHVFVIEGHSYRNPPPSSKRRAKAADRGGEESVA